MQPRRSVTMSTENESGLGPEITQLDTDQFIELLQNIYQASTTTISQLENTDQRIQNIARIIYKWNDRLSQFDLPLAMYSENTLSAPPIHKNSMCNCDGNKEICTRRSAGRPTVRAFYEAALNHRKTCPLWQFTSRTYAFGIAVHLGSLLKGAFSVKYDSKCLSLTYSMTFLRFRRPDSPAFAVLHPDMWWPIWTSERSLRVSKARELMENTNGEIEKLFTYRRAAPAELDADGQTLLSVRAATFSLLKNLRVYD